MFQFPFDFDIYSFWIWFKITSLGNAYVIIKNVHFYQCLYFIHSAFQLWHAFDLAGWLVQTYYVWQKDCHNSYQKRILHTLSSATFVPINLRKEFLVLTNCTLFKSINLITLLMNVCNKKVFVLSFILSWS